MAAVNPDFAEDRRRAITKRLAQRGTFGRNAVEEQAGVSEDFAEAAYEAFRAGGPAGAGLAADAEERLAAMADSSRESASAVEDIFARGRERENVMEMERYDRMPLFAEALNTQLSRYEDDLARRAAARASSGGRRRGPGGATPFTPIIPDGGEESTDPYREAYGAMPGSFIDASLTENQVKAWDATAESSPDLFNAWLDQADDAFAAWADSGTSFAQARLQAYNQLLDVGATPEEATALLAPYIARWESAFAGEELQYDPEAGMGPGISGPYVPSTSPTASTTGIF